VHALVGALREDDIDRALELRLLDPSITCASCGDACRALLETARTQRIWALAARERFRARNARLERRQRERAERRKPAATAKGTAAAPALPPAAAAALARAKARAAERGQR
jgi:Na+-translocating ferredoxin:NAD+ oxidoreductase RnfC subunit